MKTLNIWRKVFFAIAGALFGVALLIGIVLVDVNNAANVPAYVSMESCGVAGLVFVIVGLILDGSKNEVAHKVGMALHVVGAALMVTFALAWYLVLPVDLTGKAAQTPAGYYECFVIIGATAVYGFGWLMTLIMHCVGRYEGCACKCVEPEADAHIAAIMKWKKLYNEGIITEREFIDKRNEILGLRK